MVSKAEQAARRRAKVEAFRKQEEATQRRRLIFIIAGAVVTAVIIVFIFLGYNGRFGGGYVKNKPSATSQQIIPAGPESSTVTKQATVTKVANTSGISGVTAYDTDGWPGDGSAHVGALEHDHVTGPVTYSITPPVGGPHNAIWMNAGVYTKPVPTERAVHNLEHGAVWITYDPDLSKADVKKLTAFVGKQTMIPESEQGVTDQANRYIDLTPWASNTLPSKVVISSWGYQLQVSSPTDPRLQKFVDTFRHNAKYTPSSAPPSTACPSRPAAARPPTAAARRTRPAARTSGGLALRPPAAAPSGAWRSRAGTTRRSGRPRGLRAASRRARP
ncbi:hypothetical protein AX769_03060 [Frondihabitans sp. PAMC 28766]|uniref:DUF3105 domain-containing protein n=1 Tax=Frondihabitans sp. PAMC 28766 TaxID=1795630 RepID=UPI00078E7BBC|nr:DUF3105 domain-containing protein [Frondihabitans sp. PAMC 28766]AMM19297.1 hypothetical protein AX769_03060 [Frondihabitans sp. PAMC 28766]